MRRASSGTMVVDHGKGCLVDLRRELSALGFQLLDLTKNRCLFKKVA